MACRPAGSRILRGVAVGACAALLAEAASAVHREPRKAEYAVRWNPAEGGPATAADVVALLGGARASGEASEVRYFDLPRPASAPPGAAVILRLRAESGGGSEVRLKYRLAHPLGEPWACPAGLPFHASEQVDVGFGGADAPSRVYSYSCSLSAAEPPPGLHAVARRCVSRMVRQEAGAKGAKYKVEAWTLPDGGARLEISRTAANSVEELARFSELVARLRGEGVKALDESKTELGGRCP